MNEYKRLQVLIDEDPDQAVREAITLLDRNPDDAAALFMIAVVFIRAEKFGYGYNLFKRLVEMVPKKPEPWNNLGMCQSGMGQHRKARDAYSKAWSLEKKALYAANIGLTHMELREHRKAIEWCDTALRLDPDCTVAKVTRGFARLATGNWSEGWKDARSSIGGKFRKVIQFRDEPMWDGTPGKHLVIYGEQGLGDEIMYASCIEDIARENKVVIECDPRLQNLFRRSFPGIPVYGTRRAQEVEWPNEHKIDASIPIGQLPEYCRPSPGACPGKPYLKADSERRIQWRALLDSLGPKPKIGICWSGGSKHNNPKAREVGLKSFEPLMNSIEADWISLQYKDPTQEIAESGLSVKHWKRACETDDYDDTAALVAELDLVIGVHTTAHHLAGALGVPGIVLTTQWSNWVYQLDSVPWYSSATMFHKRDDETWTQTMERLANDQSCAPLRGLRSAGSGGLPRLLPVGHRDRYLPSSVSSAGAEAPA